MRILLRSTFVHAPTDQEDLFRQNFNVLHGSGLGFDNEKDEAIWGYIKSFVEVHSHVPSFDTIRTHFDRARETEVIDRLEILATVSPLTRGDFYSRLESKVEDRRARHVKELLKETAAVLETGIEIKEGRNTRKIRGSLDAVGHFLEQSHDIVVPTTGQRLSGIANKDSDGFWEEYERTKREGANLAYPNGLDQMCNPELGGIRGAKKKELWVHSGFAGSMKTTLMLNWAYVLAMFYGQSSLVYSIETPYEKVMKFIYALHTFHPKFREIRVKLGIQQPPKGRGKDKEKLPDVNDRGLSYTKIKDGELNENEERFMRIVTDDYDSLKNQYGYVHVEVPDPEKSDVTIVDIKSRAETIHSSSPFEVLFIDHLGIMSPRRWVPSTTERLNEIVRDSKRLAMNFNRGAGIAVVGLAQINREGYRAAEKNGGRYNMTNLSYSNEFERSADVISAAWIDENLRGSNQLLLQCLKSRDQAPFPTFVATHMPCCRRLITCYDNVEDMTKRWSQDEKNRNVEKLKKEKAQQQDDIEGLLDGME